MSVNVFDVPLIHVQGVPCDSLEAGIQHLYEFGQRKGMSRYNYAFLMLEEDGTYTLVERLGMPCWGAMREYGCGTRPNDYWPGDLREPRHIFPKTGNPVAISFQFHYVYNRDGYNTKEEWNKFLTEFVFNVEVSPWAKCLNDFELIINDDLITGVVFKDTKVDPTIIANMMKYVGRAQSFLPKRWCEMVEAGKHPHTSFLYMMRGKWPCTVLERYFNADPFDYTGGTFYDRYSYNRPDVEKIFGGKDNVGTVINNMTYDQLEELRMSVMEKENVAA